jgi:hypothetical protein
LPLYFSQRCIQVQHEGVGVGAELGYDEGNLVRHQAADEMHVARQTIQLRNNDRTLEAASISQGGGELRATIQRVGAFAGFDLDKLGDDL